MDPIAALAPDTTRYTDTAVSGETGYTYRVRAVNQGGASGWSNEASGTTGLGAPAGLQVRNSSPLFVFLAWQESNQGETGLELEVRRGDGDWLPLLTLPGNSTSYLDHTVSEGTMYTYRVRSIGPGGPSEWSNEVSVTPRRLQ